MRLDADGSRHRTVLEKTTLFALGMFVLWGVFVLIFIITIFNKLKTGDLGRLLLLCFTASWIFVAFSNLHFTKKRQELGLTNAWEIVTGPEPADPDEAILRTWGRRCVYSWTTTVLMMAALIVEESLRGNL